MSKKKDRPTLKKSDIKDWRGEQRQKALEALEVAKTIPRTIRYLLK